jgi:hypothetical protein
VFPEDLNLSPYFVSSGNLLGWLCYSILPRGKAFYFL